MMSHGVPVVQQHEGDLPGGVEFTGAVAVRVLTSGPVVLRDAPAGVLLSDEGGAHHFVRLNEEELGCPNLKALISNPEKTKVFHSARIQVSIMQHWLGVPCYPSYCTEIASRLARTYAARHDLDAVMQEFVGAGAGVQELDWGAENLDPDLVRQAAQEVGNLHTIRAGLADILSRKGRSELAGACFDFIPVRAALDSAGWRDVDVFEVSPPHK